MKEFLINLLGEDRVKFEKTELAEYAEDYTEAPKVWPDWVATVNNTEEVQAIVREANEKRIPLTPRVYGTNIGGLTIPEDGGGIVDFTQMNRVLSVNQEDMYAEIEPGVTQEILKNYLVEHDIPLTLGFSLAPPWTSTFANALLGGLTNRSLKYGNQSDWISGLEVVMPDGTLVKTGTWAVEGVSPFGRVPLPDITGLFSGWAGTTGMATRMAFQLWPLHPINKRLFILSYSSSATYTAMQRLCRMEICDDIGGLSWPSGKMMMGVKRPHPVPDDGEPTFFLYVDLTAEWPEEMALKERMLQSVIDERRQAGERYEDPLDIDTLVKVNPAMIKFAVMPTELDFLTDHGGGGLTWIGTYGPVSKFIEGAEAGTEIMVRHGFPPMIVSRPMRGGHYGVLRFICIFDKKNPDEVERVKAVNHELLQMVTEKGFIMYKTPSWAWKILSEKMDPGMLKLMSDIKGLVDPNRIMNPGKLGL